MAPSLKSTTHQLILSIIALCLLSGCVSTSNVVTNGNSRTGSEALKNETKDSINQRFTEGVTHKDEIIAYMGEPTYTSYTTEGRMIMTYRYMKNTAGVENYIPYNVFSKSSNHSQKEFVVLLDENDIVKKMNMSETKYKTRQGL